PIERDHPDGPHADPDRRIGRQRRWGWNRGRARLRHRDLDDLVAAATRARACASLPRTERRTVMNVSIPELELQQEIQRFTTRFVDRITQGAEALQGSSRAAVRDAAMRKNLLYASSALEIATGASA